MRGRPYPPSCWSKGTPTMPIIQFCRATNPSTPEAVRINSGAVLFVETSPHQQVGQTLVQVLGQTEQGIRVVESLPHVLELMPGAVGMRRHYPAGAPPEGESVVYIYPENIASVVPSTPLEPVFWTITFKDQFALRVMAPLLPGL